MSNQVKPSRSELIGIISTISRQKPENVKPASRLRTDLGLDSLLSLELLVTLEEQYGLVIEQEAAYQFQTVQDLLDYTEKQ